jgi:hypothetical protein
MLYKEKTWPLNHSEDFGLWTAFLFSANPFSKLSLFMEYFLLGFRARHNKCSSKITFFLPEAWCRE